MKCENCFCIYEKSGDCVLNEISLNASGACNECTYPSIDREYLERAKRALLERYEKEDL